MKWSVVGKHFFHLVPEGGVLGIVGEGLLKTFVLSLELFEEVFLGGGLELGVVLPELFDLGL